MHILVTAGNTLTPIDKVRGITNIFTGRTGTAIALHAHHCGHRVTLLTSRPEIIDALRHPEQNLLESWDVQTYHTFDDLEQLLAKTVPTLPDVIIHCAAVSDYRVAGVYAPQTNDDKKDNKDRLSPNLTDVSEGKVKSRHPELWLRLIPTPKLIDKFRSDWQFRGLLVKFKLEVGLSEAELLAKAESARQQSLADLMVANSLETAHEWAYLGPLNGSSTDNYRKVSRSELPARLLAAIVTQMEKSHG